MQTILEKTLDKVGLTKKIMIKAYNAGMFNEPAMEIARHATNMWCSALGRFFEQGRQVFQVGPMLRKSLINTEIEQIDSKDFKFPYDSFHIPIDPIVPEWNIYNPETCKNEPLLGLYVYNFNDDPKISLQHTNAFLCTVVLVTKEFTSILQIPRFDRLSDSVSYMKKSIEKFPSFENELMERLYGKEVTAIQGMSIETTAELLRFVINFCLYMTCKNKELVQGSHVDQKKVKKLQRRLKQLSPSNGRYAGIKRELEEEQNKPRVTIIDPSLEKRMQEHENEVQAAIQAGRRPPQRHWVTGHFQRYWTGTGRTKLIRTWKKPFEKSLENEGPGRDHYQLRKATP